ncbi:MAG: cell division protein CrgA, partial [Oscillospiraceae bacterium]|nr:cell division protein CrgA [Oscillospiraceae bacterium]
MPQKKSTTTKRKTTSKRITKKQQEVINQTRAQLLSVVLLAVGILYLALAFIEGESLWRGLHNIFFGLFGAGNYVVGFMLIVVALLSTKATEPRLVTAKLWQGGILVVMICSAIHIFTIGLPDGEGFFSKIAELYKSGVDISGGGVIGAILGWPLSTFGATPAKITIIVLTILFVMILTGVTLLDILSTVKKPVKRIEQAYIDQLERNEVKRAEQEKVKKAKFNIDVDLGPDMALPEHPVRATKPKVQKEELPKEAVSSPPPAPAPVVEQKQEEIAPPPAPTPQPEVLDRPVAPPLMLDDIINKVTVTVTPNPEVVETVAEENDNLIAFSAIKNITDNENSAEDKAIKLIDSENISEVQDTADYQYPPLHLLNPPAQKPSGDVSAELKANAELLVDTLKSFGVHTKMLDISRGPTVTRYELQPSAGVKISKITGLADDIALNLAA